MELDDTDNEKSESPKVGDIEAGIAAIELPKLESAESATADNSTQEIIGAIQRIMASESDMLETDPDASFVSTRAAGRVKAALQRLTGDQKSPPTVLEALVLEALDPILQGWMENNLAPLVERLVREEIRHLIPVAEQNDQNEKIPSE